MKKNKKLDKLVEYFQTSMQQDKATRVEERDQHMNNVAYDDVADYNSRLVNCLASVDYDNNIANLFQDYQTPLMGDFSVQNDQNNCMLASLSEIKNMITTNTEYEPQDNFVRAPRHYARNTTTQLDTSL